MVSVKVMFVVSGLMSVYLALASGADFVEHVATEHIHEDRR